MREERLSHWQIIGILMTIVIGYSLQAAQNVFTGAVDHQWFNAGNWTLGIPEATDDVVINGTSAVILQNGDAVANTITLNDTGFLRINKKARLNLFGTATVMQVDSSAIVEFGDFLNPQYQEINLRNDASINMDGTIIGSNTCYIQNAQSGLSNIIVNGTLDESVGPVTFKNIIITGKPTILGDNGLIVESGEIRLNGATDIPFVNASGFIGGNFSIRDDGRISNTPGAGDTTIDLAGITGADRVKLSIATVHIQNGLDPSGNLADGRTWEILKNTTLDFSGSTVNGLTNNTILKLNENAQVSQLALTSIDVGSTLRLVRTTFDGGDLTLQDNGLIETVDSSTISNITIEGTSSINFAGTLNNVTFRIPVNMTYDVYGTNLRCEAATTIQAKFNSDLVATGPVHNQGEMRVQPNGSIELLGGYTADANATLFATEQTGHLRIALNNSTLDSGGIINAWAGTVEFVDSPLRIITNNTTYQRGNQAILTDEEITRIDTGSAVEFPDGNTIFDLNGRTLQNDGELKLNGGTISNGTVTGTGTFTTTGSMTLENVTIDYSLSPDYDLFLSNATITGDVTMLNEAEIFGFGRIDGHAATEHLGVSGGTLEILGDFDLLNGSHHFVTVDRSSGLSITRNNPGSPFDYGGIWDILDGGILQLNGESGTSIPLDGNTIIKFPDPQLPANFSINWIKPGSTLQQQNMLPLDMNGQSMQVDGSFIIQDEVDNGTITGSGIVTVRSMMNMTVSAETLITSDQLNTMVTDSTFNGKVTLQTDVPQTSLVTNSTFNGPIQLKGNFDAVGGTVNVLGEIITPGFTYSSSDGGFLRINVGDTNGHLPSSLKLRFKPSGITEVLGSMLTVIDSGAAISYTGGESRNISIQEIQPNGLLFIMTDSLDLNGQNLLNNGEINLTYSSTLRNGTITGSGVVNVQSATDNNVLFNNITLQQPVLFHDATLRLNNSTLDQGTTFFTKSTIIGSGVVNGPILIDGTITADASGQTLLLTGSLNPRSYNSISTVKATNNANLELNLDDFGKADIIVEDATLTLDNPLTIDSQKTLTARGTITGSISNANTTSIGNTVGNLVITENYSQIASGTLNLKVGGNDPGQSDQLIVNGNADLAGKLNLKKINGYHASLNDEIRVLKWSSHSGTFTTIKFPPTKFPKKKGKWVAEYRNDGLYIKAVPNIKSVEAGG